MFEVKFLGIELYYILSWFFLFSFLGWAFESTFVSICEKKLTNRGFVTGPVCTIYGAGCLGYYLTLHNYTDNYFIMYFGGLVVATVIEYITAVLMENIFHTKWWDYSHKKIHFQGRICLTSSLAWGAFAILVLKVLFPFATSIINLVPFETGKIVLIIVMIVYLIDYIISWVSAAKLSGRLEKMQAILESVENYVPVSKITTGIDNLKEKVDGVISLGLTDNLSNIRGEIEKRFEGIFAALSSSGVAEIPEEAKAKVKDAYEKYVGMVKESSFFQNRILTAYPHMQSAKERGQKPLDRMKAFILKKAKKK